MNSGEFCRSGAPDLYASDGSVIGRITALYVGENHDFGHLARVEREQGPDLVVPLVDAAQTAGGVTVPYPSVKISSTPGVHSMGALTVPELIAILDHYGVDFTRFKNLVSQNSSSISKVDLPREMRRLEAKEKEGQIIPLPPIVGPRTALVDEPDGRT